MTTTSSEMSQGERLREQIELLLAQKAVGRSHILEQMLRFLLARALEGVAPKEVEIAEAVFGHLPGEGDADSSVRVYMHRLRRKLSEFYAGPGRDLPWQIALPKGSYLLLLSAANAAGDTPEPDVDSAPPSAIRRWRLEGHALWLAHALVLLPLLGLFAGWQLARWNDDPNQVNAVQASRLWRPLFTGNRRVALVVGDYYIFGDRDADGNVTRMIRAFDVNSSHDLDAYKAMAGVSAQNYTDLGLSYLPLGMASAIRSVAPVLSGGRNGLATITTLPASQLDFPQLQNSNIVYLGYLSGLGRMRDAVLDGSNFAVGTSYDEIIDKHTGRHFLAASHLDVADAAGEDYALVISAKGGAGNRALIISGTRDAALTQVADFLVHPHGLSELEAKVGNADSFEVLIGVNVLHGIGLDAHVIEAYPRKDPEADDGNSAWPNKALPQFPDQLPSGARP